MAKQASFLMLFSQLGISDKDGRIDTSTIYPKLPIMTSSNIAQHECLEMTSRPTFAIKKALILLAGVMVLPCLAAEGAHTSIQKLITENLDQDDSRVITEVGDLDLMLAGCGEPKAFLPYPVSTNGGRTTVGFHCTDEQSARYVPVVVRVSGAYWAAAKDIPRGTAVTQPMLVEKTGDLSRLPRNVVLKGDPVVGLQSNRVLKAGYPIQKTSLQPVFAVKRNQLVEIVASGPGFAIKSEGTAMDNGAIDDSIRVKIKGGNIVRARVAGSHLLKIEI